MFVRDNFVIFSCFTSMSYLLQMVEVYGGSLVALDYFVVMPKHYEYVMLVSDGGGLRWFISFTWRHQQFDWK